MPLLTCRYERYIILFQYSFGSAACLAYLSAVNLADFRPDWRRLGAAALALCLSVSCFREKILPEAEKYETYCADYAQFYSSQRAALDTIPADASVAATTFYTAYLSGHSRLYDIHYCTQEQALSCDYVAVKISDEGSLKSYATETASGYESFKSLLLSSGYRLYAEYAGVVEVYTKIS